MSSDAQNNPAKAADDTDLKAERSPAPIFLIVLFALLIYWSMIYLEDHGGGFNPKVYEPYASIDMVQDKQPKTGGDADIIRSGQQVFHINCAICHQENGSGSTANGCPPLVGSEWVIGGGPNRIIRLVLNGGISPITVKGEQYPGTTAMTPFRESLKDEQIAAALSYVRNAWGNKSPIVKPEQVKKIKAATETKMGNWTSTELLQIPDSD